MSTTPLHILELWRIAQDSEHFNNWRAVASDENRPFWIVFGLKRKLYTDILRMAQKEKELLEPLDKNTDNHAKVISHVKKRMKGDIETFLNRSSLKAGSPSWFPKENKEVWSTVTGKWVRIK